ncbi:serine protease, V8 domain protein [Bacillus clarus]|uniref:Serine protease, V8 domain protein n=1 Tax=Bacillus clarus TaxID=2338372 RepID=A0A090Z3N6_9BACI|nr:serine protease, V8 domain protein [Bacillus clarus]
MLQYPLFQMFWKTAVIVNRDDNFSAWPICSLKKLIDNLEFAYGGYKTYRVTAS